MRWVVTSAAIVFLALVTLTTVSEGSFGDSVSYDDALNTIYVETNITDRGASDPRDWDMYSDIVTSIVVRDGVEYVGDYAFRGFGSVTTLVLPASLVGLGNSTFADMVSLETLDCSATDVSVPLDGRTFSNSGIPEGMSLVMRGDVPNGLFSGTPATRISDVTFIGTVKIGDHAFYGSSLKEIVFPDTVERIGESAFSHTGLTSICLAHDISVMRCAFSGCDLLRYADISGLESVPDGMMMDCTELEEIVFSPHLAYIGNDSFRNTGLKELQLAYSVSFIGKYAFKDCASLRHVTILGHNVTVDEGAFKGCPIEVAEMQSGTALRENVFDLTWDSRVLIVGCPEGTMISGCNVYSGQGQGGKVIGYDISYLGLQGFMVFYDTVVDTDLLPSNGEIFTGWLLDDGSAYVVGKDVGEVTLHGTWNGEGYTAPTEPFIDPVYLDVVSYIFMTIAAVCAVMSMVPKRSS